MQHFYYRSPLCADVFKTDCWLSIPSIGNYIHFIRMIKNITIKIFQQFHSYPMSQIQVSLLNDILQALMVGVDFIIHTVQIMPSYFYAILQLTSLNHEYGSFACDSLTVVTYKQSPSHSAVAHTVILFEKLHVTLYTPFSSDSKVNIGAAVDKSLSNKKFPSHLSVQLNLIFFWVSLVKEAAILGKSFTILL